MRTKAQIKEALGAKVRPTYHPEFGGTVHQVDIPGENWRVFNEPYVTEKEAEAFIDGYVAALYAQQFQEEVA